MAPRLSIAMIVKDEAEHLPFCLASVAPLAPQVVVADTGSTDGTPALAASLGAEVHEFTWAGDFSAARNESLRHCSAPWILVLDADERIAAEDLPALEALVKEAPERAWRFTTRNYTTNRALNDFTPCAPGDTHSGGYPGWFPSVKVRLFPSHPRVRFSGAVHELVNASLEALGIPIEDTGIPIHHYPLERTEERVAQKRAMYLELGEAKVRDAPGDPKAWEELAEQYLELGRVADAVMAYRQAVTLAPAEPRLLAGLGAVLAIAGQPEAAGAALDLALKLDPQHLPALRNRAVLHLQAEQDMQAEPLIRDALSLAPRDAELHRYLAIALDGLDRHREAVMAAEDAVKLDPGNKEAAGLLAQLREE